jgi:hypothetical protein
MFPSLSMVTKRVKSSLQTIFFAILPTSLMHERISGFSDDPDLFFHGLELGSFKASFWIGLRSESDGEGESFRGDLKRCETLIFLSVPSDFLFRPIGLF